MRRVRSEKREGWQQRACAHGLIMSTAEEPYWDESAFYEFTGPEVEKLSKAAEEVHSLYLQAIEVVIKKDIFVHLGIQDNAKKLIIASWRRKDFQLYGRFDFIYSDGDAKLLEYNADTPTTLLEAASIQKAWLQETHGHQWQFNCLEESLIERWRQFPLRSCHFACLSHSPECLMTTEYLQKTAELAGIKSSLIAMEEIGYDSLRRQFVGLADERIQGLFKLYPWEWLLEDPFGQYLGNGSMRLVEPAWKMLLNNKAMLALLWKLYPSHPNLLPSYFTLEPSLGSWVRKPFFSCEGHNIHIHHQGESTLTDGSYGSEGHIYQQFIDQQPFDGHRPNLGLWMVGDLCCGLGIREDTSRVIHNNSRFIPHLVV